MNPLLFHGGALDAASERFGVPASGWLDLSTGIAPYAYPVDDLPGDAWTRLPLGSDTRAFVEAVRQGHDLPDTVAVLPTAGEQGALQVLPLCDLPPGPVAVPEPGYTGHADAWSLYGRTVIASPRPLDHAGNAAVVVVINPNNPTGEQTGVVDLLEAARKQAAIGGLLVVDEAFAEVTPDASVLPFSGRPGLLVLRSFGKFFGLPGIRLGWVAGPAPTVADLETRLGPWNVSGPALAVGARAERDQAWRTAQRQRLRRQGRLLEDLLENCGYPVVGGTDLFKLARTPRLKPAPQVFEALARRGILVRAFRDRPDLLRFGLFGTEAEGERLRLTLQMISRSRA
ncbi:threonine-phosphate decarboxylase [Phaeovibrio sulfidiphilus]|uniref:threonine-phosphate decarboxylase n=1 Tax=Phaeovibrio sulfidiphilus TaxID=1220600 RepID=A0A8J6YNI6_9PROT|nr:threonine-phosphate decarboxylase CobD [Phaeovibrio sulfidiphilus]MBE1236611.1 threonine-phosphate decarboxylase [Phaeovibrio sulfidiphilus]